MALTIVLFEYRLCETPCILQFTVREYKGTLYFNLKLSLLYQAFPVLWNTVRTRSDCDEID